MIEGRQRMIRLCALLALALGATLAQADTQSELRAIEKRREIAIQSQDFATLQTIYSPDFVAVTADGRFVNRDQLFMVFRKSNQQLSFDNDDIRIVVAGNDVQLAAEPAPVLRIAVVFGCRCVIGLVPGEPGGHP